MPRTVRTSPNIDDALLASWRIHLRAANLAPRTIQSYEEAARRFAAFLAERGLPTAVDAIKGAHVEAFLDDLMAQGQAAATAAVRYRSLQQMFRWLVDEDELAASPMTKMRAPRVPEQPVPILSDEDLRRLLATCEGKTFEDRRDQAILRVFIDTGARLAEVAGLSLSDVDQEAGSLRLMGKGRRVRVVAVGAKTQRALDRWMRGARPGHTAAGTDALWLGKRGPMTVTGVAGVVKTRAAQAGLKGVHPHRFRHTFAHQWRVAQGSDDGLMSFTGWRSREMLGRYGASAAASRAMAEHRRISPGDRL